MDNLFSLQRSFLESFQGIDAFKNQIKIKGPSPQNRLSVYHNNINQALRKSLSLIYPLTWKLVGELCANGAAYAFIRKKESLPTTTTLEEWGAHFPDFLESFPHTQSLLYLPDFAKMEWLKHMAYCAENTPSLTATHFKNVAPEDYARLSLKLHPTLHLISSSYPLDQILDVVEEKVASIELEDRSSHALIVRPYKTVEIHWIPEHYFTFFSDIQKGTPLLKAVEKIPNPQVQFHEILSFSLQNGVFSDYILIGPEDT
jgi:hypothetical protein